MKDPISPQELIEAVREWANRRDDIRAVVLVGSHARGDARPDSDVDFVLVCRESARYLRPTDWVAAFSEVHRVRLEDWGRVQSVRAFYRAGIEAEFGFAALDWLGLPLDAGTAALLANAGRILLDRDGALLQALRSLPPSH